MLPYKKKLKQRSFKKTMKFYYTIILLLCISLSADSFRALRDEEIENSLSTSANIDHLLVELISKANSTGFIATSYGKDHYKVYGMAQCRRDVSREGCSACLQEIAEKHQLCPKQKSSTIWYDHCYLMYNTHDFFGKLNMSEYSYQYSLKNVTHPGAFRRKQRTLLDKVVADAIVPKKKGVGKGKIKWSNSTIFALAQCSRDLPPKGCAYCLNAAVGNFSTICNNSQGCRVIYKSCYVRYQLYSFFFPLYLSNYLFFDR